MGSLVGGPAGLFNTGEDAKLVDKSVLSKEQQSMLAHLRSVLMGQLGDESGPQSILDIISGKSEMTNNLAGSLYKNALLDPAMREFQSSVLPSISSEFAKYGGTLSSRRGSTIMGAASKIQADAMSQITGLLPSLMGLQVEGIRAAQGLRDSSMENALKFALSPTMTTAIQPKWGITNSDILNTASMFGGMAMSDRRLKRDVKMVGTYGALGVYEYTYIWGGPRFVGFMADEVENLYPEAVSMFGEFKVVDYSKVR